MKSAPGLKAEIDELVENCIKESAKLAARVETYKKAIECHANLKGLKGSERQAYEAAAMDDLRTRLGNAQLMRIKQEAGIVNEPRQRKAGGAELPEGERVTMPRDRKREQVIAQEISSCLTGKEKEELATALREGREPAEQVTAKIAELSSLKQYAKQEGAYRAGPTALVTRIGATLGSVFDQATGSGKGDAGDDIGCWTIRLGARAACAVANRVLKAIKAPDPPGAVSTIQEIRQSLRTKC